MKLIQVNLICVYGVFVCDDYSEESEEKFHRTRRF